MSDGMEVLFNVGKKYVANRSWRFLSSDDVLGFGWGTESRLSCRYLTSLGDDVLQRDHILTSATDGYFVSSALVICEPPSQVFSRDSSLNGIASMHILTWDLR